MSSNTTPRHQSRERALSLLYEAEIKDLSLTSVLEGLLAPPALYVSELLASVGKNRARADELITKVAVGWPLARMASLDRSVLRLAVCEMLMENPPPTPVIIDEAVELASVFSTERSGSFVNGVLSSIAAGLAGGAMSIVEEDLFNSDPLQLPQGALLEDEGQDVAVKDDF